MREKPKTEEEALALWSMVSEAVQKIYTKKTGDLKYQDLFDVFHKLTMSPFADKLNAWLKSTLSIVAVQMVNKLKFVKEGLLDSFNKELAEYFYVIDKIQKVAIYYDIRFAAEKSCPPTSCIGYEVATNHLESEDGHILKKLVSSLLDCADEYRAGKYTDYLQLRTSIQNLVQEC